jgi:fluoroacetyl-CoA thioesterase
MELTSAAPHALPRFKTKHEPMNSNVIGSHRSYPINMPKPMPLGARATAEQTVEFRHTLTTHHPELPPVYSTPEMIRLMETAAFLALQPHCDNGEITVGTAINVEHRAASGVGSHIIAEAVLESFDGRFYTLRVTARDDVQEIGRGTVNRAVVSVSKFLDKMKTR